jgi:RHS repeat-associated protein
VVDANGDEVGHVIYDAYGQIVENTITLTLTDRLYTDQVFDASTGLYYYNARYYDPLTGQFTQPDSIVPDPLNPAAWNRFSYVYGNPTNYVDPTGHFAWDLTLDLPSFGASLNDFVHKPTLGNFIGLALDTVGLLPLIPAVGAIRHAGKLDTLEKYPIFAAGGEPFAFGRGLRDARAQALVEEAAQASGIELSRYVDTVLYNPGLGAKAGFRYDTYYGRTIIIGPDTFRQTKAGQLVTAAHELVHAQKFDFVLRQSNFDPLIAREVFERTYHLDYNALNYLQFEIVAEKLALRRVERYLGGVSPQLKGVSTRYIDEQINTIKFLRFSRGRLP